MIYTIFLGNFFWKLLQKSLNFIFRGILWVTVCFKVEYSGLQKECAPKSNILYIMYEFLNCIRTLYFLTIEI